MWQYARAVQRVSAATSVSPARVVAHCSSSATTFSKWTADVNTAVIHSAHMVLSSMLRRAYASTSDGRVHSVIQCMLLRRMCFQCSDKEHVLN